MLTQAVLWSMLITTNRVSLLASLEKLATSVWGLQNLDLHNFWIIIIKLAVPSVQEFKIALFFFLSKMPWWIDQSACDHTYLWCYSLGRFFKGSWNLTWTRGHHTIVYHVAETANVIKGAGCKNFSVISPKHSEDTLCSMEFY